MTKSKLVFFKSWRYCGWWWLLTMQSTLLFSGSSIVKIAVLLQHEIQNRIYITSDFIYLVLCLLVNSTSFEVGSRAGPHSLGLSFKLWTISSTIALLQTTNYRDILHRFSCITTMWNCELFITIIIKCISNKIQFYFTSIKYFEIPLNLQKSNWCFTVVVTQHKSIQYFNNKNSDSL